MNLVKILKDCPKGTLLYSSIYGPVMLKELNDSAYPIVCKVLGDNKIINFTKEDKYTISYPEECVLFPSKNNRDWNQFNNSVEEHTKELDNVDSLPKNININKENKYFYYLEDQPIYYFDNHLNYIYNYEGN